MSFYVCTTESGRETSLGVDGLRLLDDVRVVPQDAESHRIRKTVVAKESLLWYSRRFPAKWPWLAEYGRKVVHVASVGELSRPALAICKYGRPLNCLIA